MPRTPGTPGTPGTPRRPTVPSRPASQRPTGERTVLSAHPRLSERRAADRRRSVTRGFYVAATVVGLAALVWVVGFSSLLSVRQLEVKGVAQAEERAVSSLAGAALGQPLSRVDTEGIAARVRTRPSVAEAKVSRSWPSTLVIQVKERAARLLLKAPDGTLQLVDATGVAFASVDKAPAGLPAVTATSAQGMSEASLKAAASLITTLPVELSRDVTAISVTSASLVTFTVRGVDVTWGGADRADQKVAVLRALLATKPKAIDVSAPDTPTTR